MTFCNACRRHVDGVKFLKAPKCLEERALWEQWLGCKLGDYSKICETHFRDSQWMLETKRGQSLKKRRLNEDAVPQLEPKLNVQKLGYENSSTQTEDNILKSTLRVEIQSLRKRLREMDKENSSLRQQLEEYKELEKSLGNIFTDTQVKILKSGGKRATFNATDMSAAICLHAAGARAYNHLYEKGFPLPSRSTIYRWLADVNINPGTLDVVIDLMENEEMPEEDKLCVLSIDKMQLSAASENDSSEVVVNEPKSYVQLAIVRGLKRTWKQPVYFGFNTQMDAVTLNTIVKKLYRIDYPVVAIVSDLGAENQGLWRELGISETKTWFSHSADEEFKIFVFSDARHLIELFHNHYNVEHAWETADLFKLLNDWQDVFSSKLSKNNYADSPQPYGKQIDIQQGILNKMSEIMRTRIAGKADLLPFQKGILINNASLDGLYSYLTEKYGINYILTSRLSQDIVEKFFGSMRSIGHGGQFDHLTPNQFRDSIRKYIKSLIKLEH